MLLSTAAAPSLPAITKPLKGKRGVSLAYEDEMCARALADPGIRKIFEPPAGSVSSHKDKEDIGFVGAFFEPPSKTKSFRRRAVSNGATVVPTEAEIQTRSALASAHLSLTSLEKTLGVAFQSAFQIADDAGKKISVNFWSQVSSNYAASLIDTVSNPGYKAIQDIVDWKILLELLTLGDNVNFPFVTEGEATASAELVLPSYKTAYLEMGPSPAALCESSAFSTAHSAVRSKNPDIVAPGIYPISSTHKIDTTWDCRQLNEYAAKVHSKFAHVPFDGGSFGWVASSHVYNVVCGRPQLMSYKTTPSKDGTAVFASSNIDKNNVPTTKLCYKMRTVMVTERAWTGGSLLASASGIKGMPKAAYDQTSNNPDSEPETNENSLFLVQPIVDQVMRRMPADLFSSVVHGMTTEINSDGFGVVRTVDKPNPTHVPNKETFSRHPFTETANLNDMNSVIAGLVAGFPGSQDYTKDAGDLSQNIGGFFEEDAEVCTSYGPAFAGGFSSNTITRQWSAEVALRMVNELNKTLRHLNLNLQEVLEEAWNGKGGGMFYSMQKFWEYCVGNVADASNNAKSEYFEYWQYNFTKLRFFTFAMPNYTSLASTQPKWMFACQHHKILLAFHEVPSKIHYNLMRNYYQNNAAQVAAQTTDYNTQINTNKISVAIIADLESNKAALYIDAFNTFVDTINGYAEVMQEIDTQNKEIVQLQRKKAKNEKANNELTTSLSAKKKAKIEKANNELTTLLTMVSKLESTERVDAANLLKEAAVAIKTNVRSRRDGWIADTFQKLPTESEMTEGDVAVLFAKHVDNFTADFRNYGTVGGLALLTDFVEDADAETWTNSSDFADSVLSKLPVAAS